MATAKTTRQITENDIIDIIRGGVTVEIAGIAIANVVGPVGLPNVIILNSGRLITHQASPSNAQMPEGEALPYL